ncbi:MAG TPA: hypothetical protein VMN38_04160 [Sphingomicrobium sp.]|nr:hypothetical protein [Sphingomicrobium sp.]
MAEIGARAAQGQSPAPETLRRVEEIASKAPLAPEPFLIKGALAQVQQQQEQAERLFVAARTRDPRSVAARYFLAERYLRTGRIALALGEIAALSRLFPEARAQFGPALAAFSSMPGSQPQLRSFFRSSPEMEPLVLLSLAEDARSAELIMALWGGRRPGAGEPRPEWEAKLLSRLVEAGQFTKAHAIWRQVAGVNPDGASVFNRGFREVPAPPPFNWRFASAGAVVEPAAGDRLQVIYYGREDIVLAEQLLVLPPGRYQLAMAISGPLGEGSDIAWTLTCVPRTEPVFRLPVDRTGQIGGNFAVPERCPAQRLQLVGSAGEFSQSREFTVGRFSLMRAGA